jgi:predicted transcriptional regulator
MTPKLTPEQREALDHSDGPVPVEDEQRKEVYFLVDASTMNVLQRQQDLESIREGIADVEAGRVAPLDEALARIRANLGLTEGE